MEMDVTSDIQVCAVENIDDLEKIWDSLGHRPQDGIQAPGCSSSWDWHQCLRGFLLRERETLVLSASRDGQLVCLLPLALGRGDLLGVHWHTLEHWQDIALTRPGLITQNPTAEILSALFAHLSELMNWGILTITVIRGSMDEAALLGAARMNRLTISVLQESTAGYFNISELDLEVGGGEPRALGKKFRYNLRRNLRLLSAEGETTLELFHYPDDIDRFLECVWEIERATWKFEEGSTIIQQPAQKYLYTRFAHLSAARSRFIGAVMNHCGKPVAYDYGVVFNGMYECLKTSYISEYAKYSPTHLMRSMLINHLSKRGIEVHDFIGVMDQGKAQWKSLPYDRITYQIQGPGWPGTAAGIKQILGKGKESAMQALVTIKSRVLMNSSVVPTEKQ